jgi:hypothetical protein
MKHFFNAKPTLQIALYVKYQFKSCGNIWSGEADNKAGQRFKILCNKTLDVVNDVYYFLSSKIINSNFCKIDQVFKKNQCLLHPSNLYSIEILCDESNRAKSVFTTLIIFSTNLSNLNLFELGQN